MKNIAILTVASIIAGCATTSKIDEANVIRQERESAERAEQVNAKIDAFMKEYLGVTFGDSIDKYPNAMKDLNFLYDCFCDRSRIITVRKKFQYFDKALAHFEDGKLYAVSFFADIEDKYSIDSTNERISKTQADLAATFGLASDAFKNIGVNFNLGGERVLPLLVQRDKNSHSTSYALEKLEISNRISGIVPKGFRRRGVVISDDNLYIRLRDERVAKDRAKGEQLPEAK